MKKLYYASLFFLCLSSFSLSAQPYDNAIGLRMGFSVGLTGKTFLQPDKALEGLLHLQSQGLGLTLLLEKHAPALGTPQLQWYYGIGGHAGLWYKDRNRNRAYPLFGEDANFIAGVDGILGIEYTIKEIPFVIGLDFKPLINLIGSGEFPRVRYGGAFSIRYVL